MTIPILSKLCKPFLVAGSLKNLKIAFHNGETGSLIRFNVANLEVAKQDQPDALLLNLRGDYNKQTVEFSGKIGLWNRLSTHESFPPELRGQSSNARV